MKEPPCYPEERIVLTLREKLDQNARLIVRHRFSHALNEVVVLVDAFLRCLIGFVCGHWTEALESFNLLSNGMILSTTVPPSGLRATCSLAWIGITAQWTGGTPDEDDGWVNWSGLATLVADLAAGASELLERLEVANRSVGSINWNATARANQLGAARYQTRSIGYHRRLRA